MRILTDDLGEAQIKLSLAYGEGSMLPAGVNLPADPEPLSYQEHPLDEYPDGDGEHELLLGVPRGNPHDGEDDGEANGPDSGEEERGGCDRSVSGRSK